MRIKIGFKYPHGISSYTVSKGIKECKTIRGPEAAKYDGILVDVSKQVPDEARALLDGMFADMLTEEMLNEAISHMAGNADAKGNIRGLYRVAKRTSEGFGDWFEGSMSRLGKMIEEGSAPKTIGFKYDDHVSTHELIGPGESTRMDSLIKGSGEKCDVLIDVSDPSAPEIADLKSGPYESVFKSEAFMRLANYDAIIGIAKDNMMNVYRLMLGNDGFADAHAFEEWLENERRKFADVYHAMNALKKKQRPGGAPQ